MDDKLDDDYLSIEDAAAYLGVMPASLRRVLRSYGLAALLRPTAGKQVKIRRADLDRLPIERRDAPGRRAG